MTFGILFKLKLIIKFFSEPIKNIEFFDSIIMCLVAGAFIIIVLDEGPFL